ncbi:MAG: copper chaperone PCu(A)C [Hyphomicrobiales bacterium]|nr:copper chaperone PCu(A)C [Hyphomicrobiales bacterium]MCP4997971.1 copper chaperone PCu(A)C [Hyphomicrobiales bacterium]
MKQQRTIAVLILLAVVGGLLFWNLQSTTSPMKISNPKAVLGEGGNSSFPVFLTLENTGVADTLIGLRSPISDNAMITGTAKDDRAAIPAGSKPSFAGDGAHIMLAGVDEDLQDGSFVPLVLVFENAGEVTAKALVSRMVDGDAQKSVPNKMTHDMHGMGKVYEVQEGQPAPEILLKVQAVPESGDYRVTAETGNFAFFRPEGDQAEHVAGQGHAHLYLDGLKLQRMYGPDATIGALPAGKHSVSVTLNTNDHRAYVANGKTVTAEVEIDVDR